MGDRRGKGIDRRQGDRRQGDRRQGDRREQPKRGSAIIISFKAFIISIIVTVFILIMLVIGVVAYIQSTYEKLAKDEKQYYEENYYSNEVWQDITEEEL